MYIGKMYVGYSTEITFHISFLPSFKLIQML